MDGIHDLGGRQGFGQVQIEANEPVFHERWEAVVFSMVLAGLRTGAWNNTDRFRHAIERIDPVAYLTHGYYGRWLAAIETLLVEAGVLTLEEVDARVGKDRLPSSGHAARPVAEPAPLTENTNLLTASRSVSTPPRFQPGDEVMTCATGCSGHTRLPAYARGKKGRVIRYQGGWVFPDTNAHGQGEQPTHLYTVSFDGKALWGDATESGVCVSLDLFEPYLSELTGGE
ncbi:MAG: nitrile hydratase subunit beta, partial [Gammaproteobacteria bacterium]|nr:nitrile hydratase subunit beta [Gammaproteobacteria bacterium]